MRTPPGHSAARCPAAKRSLSSCGNCVSPPPCLLSLQVCPVPQGTRGEAVPTPLRLRLGTRKREGEESAQRLDDQRDIL